MLVGMETAMGIVARKMGVDGGIVCWGKEGEQTQGSDEVCVRCSPWCLRCGDIRSRRRSRTLQRS
jgi:hypothetical protein